VIAVLTAVLVGVLAAHGSAARGASDGGIFRISLPELDYVDPALAYFTWSWALVDTTCARLMGYPDKPPPAGYRLTPEVAVAHPRISGDGKTYTFTLRSGFRFSDGAPVRASAFARAINRTLAPGIESPGRQYTLDIVGAADVIAGKTASAAGVVARGNTLTVRFTRRVFDFAAKTTMPFFCAVPPGLPSDPEGVGAVPAAGPYYVAEYRPGERVVLRRNRFYGGTRPHHVDGFDVDLTAASWNIVLDRVERGEADWGDVPVALYLDPARGLAARYGVNRSQFFVKPGFRLRYIAFNSSRPLFRDNARLRRAVNLALDRAALRASVGGSNPQLYGRLTDQYLPHKLPGFRDADIYPLHGPDVARARDVARGATRGGKAIYYTPDHPIPVGLAQAAKRQLAEIGLDVEVRPIPISAYFERLADPDEPWDLALANWAPDYLDPSQYINLLLDSEAGAGNNLGRFGSRTYDRLMRAAARLQGDARYRAYGSLDVQLARDAAPLAALFFENALTLVSKRVGCVVLTPVLDLTAVCLE
jgi:peptide/nickel transport system substrate-binding protein